MKNKKIIIIGSSKTSEVLADLLINDSNYHVSAFVVDNKFKNKDSLIGINIYSCEEALEIFPPEEYYFIIGVGGSDLNLLRFNLYSRFISYGYSPATYISSRASVSKFATIGRHCCIMENVVIHAGCKVGDNVYVFPNAYLGHHTEIGSHSFFAANVSIGGGAVIDEFCYLGANSSVINAVKVGKSTMIGMGAVCTKDTLPGALVKMSSPIYLEGAEKSFKKWHQAAAKRMNLSK